MRHCPQALKEHFDALFKGTQLQNPRYPVDLFIAAVKSCVGVTEVGGDNRGPLVELFQASVGVPERQPWCMDFIQACIAYTELSTGAPSKLLATESVVDLWESCHAANGVQTPIPGDLILWQKRDSEFSGHCGVVLGITASLYTTIEGNTSDASGIDRDGDGIYQKERAIGGTRTFKELGFVRVFI